MYIHSNVRSNGNQSYETEKLTSDDHYMYGEVGTKEKEYNKTIFKGVGDQCQTHVENVGVHQWYNEQSWWMTNTQPPYEIRSRSAAFELCNPHVSS